MLRQVTTLSRYSDSSDGESEPESRRHVTPLAYVRVDLTYRILALQSTVSHLAFHKQLLEGEEALLQSFPTRRQMLERVVFKNIFSERPQVLMQSYLGYVVLHAVFIGPAKAEIVTVIDTAAQEKIGGSAQLSSFSTARRAPKGRRRGQRQPAEVFFL